METRIAPSPVEGWIGSSGGTMRVHSPAFGFSGKRQVALLTAVVSLMSLAPDAAAKSVQLAIEATTNQLVGMDRGSEIVISTVGASEVWMQIPAADEKNRLAVSFVFINKSDKPVNVGPESVSSDLISVVPYAKLLEEQNSRESTRRVGHFFAKLGRAMAADQAGQAHGSFDYSGQTSYGSSYYGTGSFTVTDLAARDRALERAAAENETRGQRMEQAFQYARSSISSNLQTTTLMPNQRIAGILTFATPSALRNAQGSRKFMMTIQIGPDRHVLTGYAGPSGTIPAISPSPELATYLAQRVAPPTPAAKSVAVVRPAASSQPIVAANQRLGRHGTAEQLASAKTPEQAKPKPKPRREKPIKENWGLVEVPSQSGY